MPRVLILFAHPAFQKSRINRALLNGLADLSGVTIHDLYEAYPDFHIPVEREQARLLEHDVIVFQHPFYWYSCPALLKEWMDLVLAHGFAYGEGGDKLAGKMFLHTITAGGSEVTYQTQGVEQITNQKLLLPFDRLSSLCQMIHLPPFVVFGTHKLDIETLLHVGQDYKTVIQALCQGKITPKEYQNLLRLNQILPIFKKES